MNCRVLGISIDTSINVLCSQSIEYVYNMKLLYSILGILIVILCCVSILYIKIN